MIDWLKILVISKRIFSVNSHCDDHYKYFDILGFKLKIRKKISNNELLEKIQNQSKEIKDLNNQINALKFTINNCIDVTKVPKATGLLRQLQVADTLALKIFHKFCEKNNLTYWLDYGTLLGAVRHNGFIPWDDDVDIAMPRKDYEYLRTNLYKELEQLNFEVNQGINFYHPILRIIYKSSKIIIDIFPYDNYYAENIDNKEELANNIHKCHEILINSIAFKNFKKGLCKFPTEEILQAQKELINNGHNPIPNKYIHSGCDAIIYNKPRIYKYEWIYPVKLHYFEDTQLFIPNNYDEYLKEIYINYLILPDFSDTKNIPHSHIINNLQNFPLEDYCKELQNIYENYTNK